MTCFLTYFSFFLYITVVYINSTENNSFSLLLISWRSYHLGRFSLMRVCMCMHLYLGTTQARTKALGNLELQLQTVVSTGMWVLGTQLRSLARAANALTTDHLFLQPTCIVSKVVSEDTTHGGLELTVLPQPHTCWDHRHEPYTQQMFWVLGSCLKRQ